jgi:hypothetical protein
LEPVSVIAVDPAVGIELPPATPEINGTVKSNDAANQLLVPLPPGIVTCTQYPEPTPVGVKQFIWPLLMRTQLFAQYEIEAPLLLRAAHTGDPLMPEPVMLS